MPTHRELIQELQAIAEDAEWFLSDWILDENYRKGMINRLLSHDLIPVWRKLKKSANSESSLSDLFIEAADAEYRYHQITVDHTSEWSIVKQATKDIINALQRIGAETYIASTLDVALNKEVIHHFERSNILEEKSLLKIPICKHLKTLEILKLLHCKMEEMVIETPTDSRISEKRDTSGLVAFYTNSLCAITDSQFNRKCYGEIASIANQTLLLEVHQLTTEEKVRNNYSNYLKRLANKEQKDSKKESN